MTSLSSKIFLAFIVLIVLTIVGWYPCHGLNINTNVIKSTKSSKANSKNNKLNQIIVNKNNELTEKDDSNNNNNKRPLRLASWNLLAPVYTLPQKYPWCKPEYLQWDYRQPKIIKQLKELNADIVCLQEVEINKFDSMLNELKDIYPTSILQNVTKSHPIASAVLLGKNCPLEIVRVESRSRALIVVLKDKTIANTNEQQNGKDNIDDYINDVDHIYLCNVHLEAGETQDDNLQRYHQIKSLWKRLAHHFKLDQNKVETESNTFSKRKRIKREKYLKKLQLQAQQKLYRQEQRELQNLQQKQNAASVTASTNNSKKIANNDESNNNNKKNDEPNSNTDNNKQQTINNAKEKNSKNKKQNNKKKNTKIPINPYDLSKTSSSVILAGDFNMLSSNPLHKFLSEGTIANPNQSDHQIIPTKTTKLKDAYRNAAETITSTEFSTTTKATSSSFSNKLHRKRKKLGMTYSRGIVIDYIWTSENVEIQKAILTDPNATNEGIEQYWPSKDHPSDHIPIGVDLVWNVEKEENNNNDSNK